MDELKKILEEGESGECQNPFGVTPLMAMTKIKIKNANKEIATRFFNEMIALFVQHHAQVHPLLKKAPWPISLFTSPVGVATQKLNWFFLKAICECTLIDKVERLQRLMQISARTDFKDQIHYQFGSFQEAQAFSDLLYKLDIKSKAGDVQKRVHWSGRQKYIVRLYQDEIQLLDIPQKSSMQTKASFHSQHPPAPNKEFLFNFSKPCQIAISKESVSYFFSIKDADHFKGQITENIFGVSIFLQEYKLQDGMIEITCSYEDHLKIHKNIFIEKKLAEPRTEDGCTII